MKQITRWTPDTHDCVIEYEWDDSEPAESRTHTFVRFVDNKKPQASRFTGTDKEKFDKVLEENQRKNKALGEVLNLLPEEEKLREQDEEGNESIRFKQLPRWSIDETGEVVIELPNKAQARTVNSGLKIARVKVV